MASKHIKRYSTSLVIREIQIENSRYLYTLLEWLKKKKKKKANNAKCWQECRETILIYAVGIQNGTSLEKRVCQFLIKLNSRYIIVK